MSHLCNVTYVFAFTECENDILMPKHEANVVDHATCFVYVIKTALIRVFSALAHNILSSCFSIVAELFLCEVRQNTIGIVSNSVKCTYLDLCNLFNRLQLSYTN